MLDSETPWFAGRNGEFVLFRVNRRPIGEDTLIPEKMPADVFDHFRRTLAPGYAVVTGRSHQRSWRVGGIDVAPESKTLTGKLGWVPWNEEEIVPEWDPDEKDWRASVAAPNRGGILPFGFDAETRILSVLRDTSSRPGTLAVVFERILQENEREMAQPTTEWSVEPILDVREFLDWLQAMDVVQFVAFTARLPNPEPRKEFEELAERMAQRRATRFTEQMKSDREGGLTGIAEDRDFRQAVEMARQGFADLRGYGISSGRKNAYSQRQNVARERVDDLPDTWEDMRALLVNSLKTRFRRFLREDEDAA